MEFRHTSVLLSECIDSLNIKPDGIYVDGTLGGGGHAAAICEKLSQSGLLIGIDRDRDALYAAQKRLEPYKCRKLFVQSNYSDIKNVLHENDIEKIMKTAAELINTNKHILILEARKELLRIPVSEIRYIESSGRYIIVHDSGGEYKLKGKLNDIYERVKGFGFLFIHKSYIVNNLYIRKYSYDNVELDDNVILPVSRQRREEIKKSCSIGL